MRCRLNNKEALGLSMSTPLAITRARRRIAHPRVGLGGRARSERDRSLFPGKDSADLGRRHAENEGGGGIRAGIRDLGTEIDVGELLKEGRRTPYADDRRLRGRAHLQVQVQPRRDQAKAVMRWAQPPATLLFLD